MIREITGDLIRDGQGILCHQVNTAGIMGAGIARSIREKLLSPSEYAGYANVCLRNMPEVLLGHVHYSEAVDGRIVANMFSQRDCPDRAGNLTDYQAMQTCFQSVRLIAEANSLPVTIPAYIGCGIAGGDWNRVWEIIDAVFDGSDVDTTIVYWERE